MNSLVGFSTRERELIKSCAASQNIATPAAVRGGAVGRTVGVGHETKGDQNADTNQ